MQKVVTKQYFFKIMFHVSCVMCHMSHGRCHMSQVTCCMSPVTYHMSLTAIATTFDPLPANSPTMNYRIVKKGKKIKTISEPKRQTLRPLFFHNFFLRNLLVKKLPRTSIILSIEVYLKDFYKKKKLQKMLRLTKWQLID